MKNDFAPSAFLPVVGFVLSVPLAGMFAERSLPELIVLSGAPSYGTLFFGLAGGIACSVLCLNAARGRRVPAAIPLLIAGLPWLIGALGYRAGIGAVMRALAMVNPADAQIIAVAGNSEALCNLVLGGWVSAMVLLGTGVSLALTAFSEGGEKSSSSRLALGALGLPALAATGWLSTQGVGAAGAFAIIVAVGFVAVLALSAMAPKEDADAHLGQLAAGAALCATMALLAVTSAVEAGVFSRAGSLAANDPDAASQMALLLASVQQVALPIRAIGVLAVSAGVILAAMTLRSEDARSSGVAHYAGLAIVGLLLWMAPSGLLLGGQTMLSDFVEKGGGSAEMQQLITGRSEP